MSFSIKRKNDLLKETHGRCFYCGEKLNQQMEIDHIKPKIKGGRDSFYNCAITCVTCNRSKSSMTLEKFRNKINNKLVKSLFYFELIGIDKLKQNNFMPEEYSDFILEKGFVWEHLRGFNNG